MHPKSPTNGNGNFHGEDLWKDNRLDLSGKVAIVTGAARGIGQATCVALAREGVQAIGLVDMSDELGPFSEHINRKLGREVAAPFQGDVTDAAFRTRVFAELTERFGIPSICVPAAGITRDRLAVRVDRETGGVEVYPESDWQRVLEVDLTAPVYWAMETIAAVARDRARRGLKRWTPSENVEGCVIFIGSVSSAGNKGQVSYATAKAGLEGAQATLATEAIYYGVRCAIIHPGYTDTAMVRSLGDRFITEHIIPQTQLGRLIHADEIANAICFMVRNAAVSGTLWADAGWHPTA